jgi:hypothetical protein
MEAERLRDEVMILKVAIEEAINKGQKSMGDLNDIPRFELVSNEHFTLTRMNTGSGIVGWVDDF